MKKYLKWLFVVLSVVFLIVIIAGSVFICRFDLNAYKPRIEKMVFDQTGRKLFLEGDIRLKISWVPTLNIKQASFADADWGGRKSMIEAKEIEVSVAIIPLFNKIVAVNNIKLVQPEIHLSVNDKGKGNWVFERNISEAEKKKPETGDGFVSGMKLIIKKISVLDGVITYDSPKSKINLQIKQASLKLEENRVFLNYDLLYDGREIKGTMKGETFDSLIKKGTYNAEIEADALRCHLRAYVTLTDVSGDWHADAKLDLTSPEGNFNLPALQLKSNVNADQKSVLLGIEQLEFGKSVIRGDVSASLTEKPDIRAKIASPLMDIPSLISADKASVTTAKKQNLTGESVLLLDFLNRFSAHLAFDIERLNVNENLSFDQVNGTVDVRNGILTLKPLSGKLGKGSLKGTASFSSKGNIIKIETDFRNLTLPDFLKELVKIEKKAFDNISVARLNGKFSTKGAAYRDLFKNLNMSLQFDRLVFDKSSANGNVDISFKNKLNIKGKIVSPLTDISFLIPAKDNSKGSPSSASDVSKGAFIPEGEPHLDFLNQFDTHFSFDISHLVINRNLALDKLKGTIEVKDGVLNLKPVSFDAGQGTVKGDLFLNAKENALNINMDGANIVLPDLIKSLKRNGKNFSFKKGGIARSRIALKTKGKSYRNLFENLEGQVLLTVGPSEVRFGALKYVQGDFLTQLMSALNISAKQTDANLKCAVIRADFAKGKALFPKGIVFDADQIKLVADGSVTLADDKIDMLIQPLSGNLMKTNITQILASMIKVTGTITDPSLFVNSKSVIKNAAGIAAGGAVFIGAKLLLDSDADPCYTALQGTVYSKMYKETTGIKAGMQRAYQKTSDSLEKAAEAVIDTTYESGKKVGQAVGNTADSVIQKGADTVNKTTDRFLNWFGDKK